MTDAKLFQAIQELVAVHGTSEMSTYLQWLKENALSFNPDEPEEEEPSDGE